MMMTCDDESPVLKRLRMYSTPSLPLLPGPLLPRLVVPVKVPSVAQIELFNYLPGIISCCFLKQYRYLNYLHYIGILDK